MNCTLKFTGSRDNPRKGESVLCLEFSSSFSRRRSRDGGLRLELQSMNVTPRLKLEDM
ncbi:hypothetical protein SO694_0000326 [Aureococcus anophagefferens]|uniref:Uncharacterized protein n=1 Tax=Aureococcus anophagefferens TaxID=44056 RepID=A0ABR1GDB9_AURAN